MNDPFDPKRLGLPDDLIQERKVSMSKKEKRRQKNFIIVPGVWREQLTKVKYIATYRVALHILARDFETHGKPFPLSNGALALENVSRWEKPRALAELEAVGLIRVERCKRKTPRITALHT
jgi:hypothetical protein